MRGKFIFVGDEKLYVRGVTYGTFAPDAAGNEYHDPRQVTRDFAQMAVNGINAVRTYTVPPRWLLDCAHAHGLYVMIGLPWEQHVAFLDDQKRARSIVERVRAGVRSCAGHPAVLCFTVGNEIPASIVRWYGRRRIEHFIERLYRAAKDEDPAAIVTYVNFPSTEYLQLPFVDALCFNVYLESQGTLDAYLARLQSLAGDRPLLMAEIGMDSRRNGLDQQARTLEWQVRTAFAAGCAGAFVFAWTDEWQRGGHDIDDWDFGLTDRHRQPKPALTAVRQAFTEVPFPPGLSWPRVSVVVCSYNGARTIRDCFDGLMKLDYPDFEVIVVNDGSKDETPGIAAEYPFRVISTENRGLSNARNTGMDAATGEIIAYTDDDARPDPHWLQYLAAAFMHLPDDYAGVGGPNIAPPGDGPIADCVANSPGGPVHVLLSDREAEHIPGCNMAFRAERLRAIGGFDPRYRSAGDDVDVCWRLQERGGKLGFSPAAMVWHHRRNSVRMYWRQQQGYGKAEALLEEKWPEKYNRIGHLTWGGRLYGKGLTLPLNPARSRIYHGSQGSGLFQSIYQPAPGLLSSLPLMPEWYFVIAALAGLGVLGLFWTPLLLAVPLLLLATGAFAGQAVAAAARASFTTPGLTRAGRSKLRLLTTFMHLMQPYARLRGRLRHGLTPWRRRGKAGFVLPLPRGRAVWSEQWRSQEAWLSQLEALLHEAGAVTLRGGDFDRWDLEVRGGLLGSARLRLAVEEHGAGRQLVRFCLWPRVSPTGAGFAMLLSLLTAGAANDRAWVAAAVLSVAAIPSVTRMAYESAAAFGILRRAAARTAENPG
ncbi:MAG: glycosyltransferase [Dehalococcoidia bacterium]